MNRSRISLKIASLVVVLCAATLAWSQAPLAKGSFTLPMPVRWGSLSLAQGDYTFSITHNLSTPILELRHDGRFVGFIVSAARDDTNAKKSSMLLQMTAGGYAVKELTISEVAAFSYAVPKIKRGEIVAQGAPDTSVPVQISRK